MGLLTLLGHEVGMSLDNGWPETHRPVRMVGLRVEGCRTAVLSAVDMAYAN